jgi:hypothetical protein
MAKFGLFDATKSKVRPLQEYEGDTMQQNGEYVYIYEDPSPEKRIQVAAIRLDKGQSVKKI